MRFKFWLEYLSGKDIFIDLDIDGSVVLKWFSDE
jgi:hypothetical protein